MKGWYKLWLERKQSEEKMEEVLEVVPLLLGEKMGFRKKTIRDIEITGKIVLVRVDYNVPMKDGKITEDMRITASFPTIQYLLEQGAKKVVLISHMGRPDGEVKPEFSLAPVAERLSALLPDRPVAFCEQTVGSTVAASVAALPEGGVLLLENLRFSPDEEANNEDFARAIVMSTGAELFVQDGFAVIHRAHASTDAIAKLLPAVSGFLVENEVSKLEGAMSNPEHPLVVLIGGAKVEDKTPMIDQFLPIADQILVGGKIAADGYAATDPKIYVAEDFALDEEGKKLDIGDKATEYIVNAVRGAKTVVWNGTMGMTEDERFAKGSRAVAEAMGSLLDATTIVGGGDTAGYVESLVKQDGNNLQFSLISTGGGASLELLSGKKLPGFEVLQDA